MSTVRQSCLSLWAVGLLAGACAAQAPDAGAWLPPVAPDEILAVPAITLLPPAAPLVPAAGEQAAPEPAAPIPYMVDRLRPLPTTPLVPPLVPEVVQGPVGIDAAALNGAGWFAGAGLYIIQPFFQNNPAYTVFAENTLDTKLDPNNPSTRTIGEASHRVAVKNHMSAAPLVWVGYMSEDGFGVRARGWAFTQGTSQTVNLPPFAGRYAVKKDSSGTVIVASGTLATVTSAAPLGLQAFGDTLGIQFGPESTSFNVTTKLAVQVGDFEALRRIQAGAWTVVAAGGLRYVRLDQEYNAYDAQSHSPAELRTLTSSYGFQGVGPTMAFELRRPLAATGLTLFSQFRGSVVLGTANQDASFSGAILRNDDPNPQFASNSRNRAIPIVDLETGLEHGRAVGGTWVFGQVALVGQQWFNAGSSSRSTLLTPANVPRPVLGGAPLDSNLAFLGLTVRLGLNY